MTQPTETPKAEMSKSKAWGIVAAAVILPIVAVSTVPAWLGYTALVVGGLYGVAKGVTDFKGTTQKIGNFFSTVADAFKTAFGSKIVKDIAGKMKSLDKNLSEGKGAVKPKEFGSSKKGFNNSASPSNDDLKEVQQPTATKQQALKK